MNLNLRIVVKSPQCTLLSIKTGGCVEDCKYCSQSSRYKTFVKPTPTLKVNYPGAWDFRIFVALYARSKSINGPIDAKR